MSGFGKRCRASYETMALHDGCLFTLYFRVEECHLISDCSELIADISFTSLLEKLRLLLIILENGLR